MKAKEVLALVWEAGDDASLHFPDESGGEMEARAASHLLW